MPTWILPYPKGTTNHLYEKKGAFYDLAPWYARFRDETILLVRPARIDTVGWLKLTLAAYAPDLRRRDLDNLLKATQDSLATALEIDDRRIVEIAATLDVDRAKPRLEVTIELSDRRRYS